MYIPNKHVAIDEELLFLKGRLGFWQYILNKRTWFEIKMFSLCGVTGYLCNSFVYVGKDATETPEKQALVKNLEKVVLLFQD